MAKQIVTGENSRQAILRGVNILADAEKITLGPNGSMARLVRHRQTKGPATDRSLLNHRATPRLHNVALSPRRQIPIEPAILSLPLNLWRNTHTRIEFLCASNRACPELRRQRPKPYASILKQSACPSVAHRLANEPCSPIRSAWSVSISSPASPSSA
jgi:hypothetical protein